MSAFSAIARKGRLSIVLAAMLCLAACQGGLGGLNVTAAASTAASVLATAQPAVSTAAAAGLATASLVVSTAAPALSTDVPALATAASTGSGAASTPGLTAAPSGPLQMSITSPDNEAVVKVPQVDVIGQASPDAVITINDTIVVVGATGRFSATVPLEQGPNELDVVASDADGHQTTATLFVTYDPAG